MTLGEAEIKQQWTDEVCPPSGRVPSLSLKWDLGGTSPGLPQAVAVAVIDILLCARILHGAFRVYVMSSVFTFCP